jgi:hypothetical protein
MNMLTEWLPIPTPQFRQFFSKYLTIGSISETDGIIDKFAKTTLSSSSTTPPASLESKVVTSLETRQKDLSRAIEDFKTDLEGWVKEYHQVKKSIKENNQFSRTILDGIDYILHNPLLVGLCFTVDDKIVKSKIDRWLNWFKILDLGVCLALGVYRWRMLNQQRKNIEVSQYPERLQQLQAKFQNLQEEVLNELKREKDTPKSNLYLQQFKLAKQIQTVEILFKQKHGQLTTKYTDSQDKLHELGIRGSLKTLTLVGKDRLGNLPKIVHSLGNHAIRYSRSEQTFNINSDRKEPIAKQSLSQTSLSFSTFDIFPQCNVSMITQCLEVLEDEIRICHHLELKKDDPSLKAFLDLKKSLSQLQSTLKNKSEGEISDLEEFNNLLENFHQTSALFIKEIICETGRKKEAIERKFMTWHSTQSVLLLLVYGLQIALWAFPRSPLTHLQLLVEHLTTNIVKQLPFLSFLFAEKNFKMITMGLLASEHLTFGLKDKPHEYSLEGYKLSFQMRFFRFIKMVISLIEYCQRAVCWIQARVIANQIKRLSSQCLANVNTSPYTYSYTTCLSRLQANCQKQLKMLRERFHKLALKDSKSLMYQNPNQQQKDDPFIALNRVFQHINLDYVSYDVQTFFKEKNLADPTTFLNNLEHIFIRRERKFINPAHHC